MRTPTLAEFLVLAVPDGRNEVLGGEVRRASTFADVQHARDVYLALARSICESVGAPWREDVTDEASTFDRDPYRLVLNGSTVELFLRVTPSAVELLR